MATIDPAESERRMLALRAASPLAPRLSVSEQGVTRIGSFAEVATPTVTRSGDWADYSETVGSSDLNFPLTVPGGFVPLPSPIAPPPPRPTEAQLRETLEQCIATRDFTNEAASAATEAHVRSVRHTERCRTHLASFDGLDDRITDLTVAQLRGEGGRPRPDGQGDELKRRVVERDLAKADAAAAERAERVLAAAAADARADAEKATRAAQIAAAAVTMILAERLAEKVVDLESEAQRLREKLHGADFVGVQAPQALRTVYGDGQRFLRPVDKSAWAALRQRLMDDPMAELTIEQAG